MEQVVQNEVFSNVNLDRQDLKSTTDTISPVSCYFCHKHQLSPKSLLGSYSEILQVSPVISAHKLCLEFFTVGENQSSNIISNNVIKHIENCQSNLCQFCNKTGASVKCHYFDCQQFLHLSCYFSELENSKNLIFTHKKPMCVTHFKKMQPQSNDKKTKMQIQSDRKLRNSSSKKCFSETCVFKNLSISEAIELGLDHSMLFCHSCKKSPIHSACMNRKKNWSCPKCKFQMTKKVKNGKKMNGSSVKETSLNEEFYSTMKASFCKEIDAHLRLKRRSDRSPLSLKQKNEETSKQSMSIKSNNGKENYASSLKKSKAKKRKRDEWIVNDQMSSSKRAKRSSLTTKSSRKRGRPPKKSAPASVSLESTPAKKFVENSLSHSAVSISRNLSKAFNSCDKKSSGRSVNKEKEVKKATKIVSADVIPLDNRQLYHIKNNRPIDNGEIEAEEDYNWLIQASKHQIEEFLDLNDGEKNFMKIWNTYIFKHPCFGDKMLTQILFMFVDEIGPIIASQNLYRNFVLHLVNLHEFALIGSQLLYCLIVKMQRFLSPEHTRQSDSNNFYTAEQLKLFEETSSSNNAVTNCDIKIEDNPNPSSTKPTSNGNTPFTTPQSHKKKKKVFSEKKRTSSRINSNTPGKDSVVYQPEEKIDFISDIFEMKQKSVSLSSLPNGDISNNINVDTSLKRMTRSSSLLPSLSKMTYSIKRNSRKKSIS